MNREPVMMRVMRRVSNPCFNIEVSSSFYRAPDYIIIAKFELC